MNLFTMPRDDARQVRAEAAVVVLRVLRGREAHVDEDVRVVADDVLEKLRRVRVRVVDAVDGELLFAVPGARGVPATPSISRRASAVS